MTIDKSWYDLTSPVTPDNMLFGSLRLNDDTSAQSNSSASRSLLERLVGLNSIPAAEDKLNDDGYSFLQVSGIEMTLGMFFADALSRTGIYHQREVWRTFSPWPQNRVWDVSFKEYTDKMVRPGPPIETFPLPEIFEKGGGTQPGWSSRPSSRAT